MPRATPSEPPVVTTPGAPGPLSRLPPAILQEAAKRTAWLCLSIAILFPLIQVFQRLMQPALYSVMMNDLNRLVSLATVLWAVGLFALHRYEVVGPSTILSLGMALEVFGAFAISMLETSVPFVADRPILGISKLGPWILGFGVIVPNRPLWTFICASAAASAWPLAYVINASILDYPPASWAQIGVWPLFNGFMVVLTYCIARQTYGMASAADKAQELGSYRLVAPIGEGGMGEVWKADHQMLARKAAIKLIRPQVWTARQADLAVRRFRREADAIASLQSPHTVYLYDFGVSHEGHFYYAMELLDGISLQSLVATFGPQPAGRVVPILIQICHSLEEAHRQGVVHRDLKPSNVMLCKVALTYDFVKVLDFGLAKFIRNVDSQLTMPGTATGTPGYIAPEIAVGESVIDGRADIYTLGCVAYFLLTGTMVFEDANPMQLAVKHVQTTPVPPSARTEQPIPEALEAIVLHCLAKAPADRPVSAAALAALLAAVPVERWSDDQAEAWWNRHLPTTSSLRTFHQTPIHTPAVVRKL